MTTDQRFDRFDQRLGKLGADLRLLKWMMGANIVLTLAILGSVAGLYATLFNMTARLPR